MLLKLSLPRPLLLAWWVAILTALGCTRGPSSLSGQPSIDVLIYYANETALRDAAAQNVDVLLGWLRASGEPKALTIAAQVERDRTEMPRDIDADVAEIEAGLPISMLAPRTGALIVTNRLARDGHIRIFRPGSSQFETVPFSLPTVEGYILESAPLSSPVVLRAVLAAAADAFDAKESRFILDVHSHGNVRMFLTPRVAIQHEMLTADALLQIVRGEAHPPPTARPGVSKADFAAVLEEAGQSRSMKLGLVAMETCDSGTAASTPTAIPANVCMAYTARQDSKYRNVNWRELLRIPTRSLADALDESFAHNSLFQRVVTTDGTLTARVGESWPWFLPIAAMTCWYAGKRVLRRRSA